MGYLNNSTRVLDAILTKKGREILSSGGNFEVSKFALGDDEIDYQLWDTTHTRGTDYYGAVIDNLPALEPFNDPSEIMKYKLVTRSKNTRAMAILKILDITQLTLLSYVDGSTTDRISIGDGGLTSSTLSVSTATIALSHWDNTPKYPQGTDYLDYKDENFTVTLLDASVAVLAPNYNTNSVITTEGNADTFASDGWSPNDALWVPFVDNVQHLSQTLSNCSIGDGNKLQVPFKDDQNKFRDLVVYPKQVPATSYTSIILTGDVSGVVQEFDVTINYSSS
jgi:hypothetical protein